MLSRVLAIAVAAWIVSAQAGARPLTSDELATLRGTDARYPTEAATDLARKMGREADIDGLRAIIELHQPSLLWTAVESYDSSASRLLPPALEALIVAYYKDREAQPEGDESYYQLSVVEE